MFTTEVRPCHITGQREFLGRFTILTGDVEGVVAYGVTLDCDGFDTPSPVSVFPKGEGLTETVDSQPIAFYFKPACVNVKELYL